MYLKIFVYVFLGLVTVGYASEPSRSPADTFRQAIEFLRREKDCLSQFNELFTKIGFAKEFRTELRSAESKFGQLKVSEVTFRQMKRGVDYYLEVIYKSENRPGRPYKQIIYVECPNDDGVWQLADSGTIRHSSRQEASATRRGYYFTCTCL